jgi:hypothetical protein
MVADPTQNVTVVLPQTSDSLPRSIGGPPLVYDPATGIWSGGDPLHRDIPDNQRFGHAGGASGGARCAGGRRWRHDSVHPGGYPRLGRAGSHTCLPSVGHESGRHGAARLRHRSDRAGDAGGGWRGMGGDGRRVGGVARHHRHGDRLRAAQFGTQLQITLAQGLVNASAACLLFYPYGTGMMGRGNCGHRQFVRRHTARGMGHRGGSGQQGGV